MLKVGDRVRIKQNDLVTCTEYSDLTGTITNFFPQWGNVLILIKETEKIPTFKVDEPWIPKNLVVPIGNSNIDTE